jgi:hypothetical protein
MASVIRIKPYHYIHVLDNNANTTRVEVGPQTFTSQVTFSTVFVFYFFSYVFVQLGASLSSLRFRYIS